MRQYRQLVESLPKKSVVFSFGRFQPPTAHHELLLKITQKVALDNSADHVILVSTTEDKKKNPLSVERKLHYLKMMFPTFKFASSDSMEDSVKTISRKYKNIIMVGGENKTKLPIKVISTGERDADESSAKMLSAASKGDYTAFKVGLPNSIRDINGKLLMNDIRLGMNLEVIKERIKYDVDVSREKYFNKEIFNIGDSVESAGLIYEILDRGSNYITVSGSNGEVSKKWIQDCTTTNNIKEDISQGYSPEEISFKGYTTKNLHHSGDATKAFKDTIDRYGKHDPLSVLNALKSTDEYMAVNDKHLEAGKTPDQKDLNKWRQAHTKAKESLERVGEFPHHMTYWMNHRDELAGMESNYTLKNTGAEEMNEDAGKIKYKQLQAMLAGKKEDNDVSPADTLEVDTMKAPSASVIAFKDFDNKGPKESEVGSSLGHGDDSQLRRRKVHYQRNEEVELDEAHKIGNKVKIISGPSKGFEGHIAEIRHGLFKGSPKSYTIHISDTHATRAGAHQIRKLGNNPTLAEQDEFDSIPGGRKEPRRQNLNSRLPASWSQSPEQRAQSKAAWDAKVKKYGSEAAALKSLRTEEVELEEGTFNYHMGKAISADERGDKKRKDYHLSNARSARNAMPSKDYPKNKELFDKLKHAIKQSNGDHPVSKLPEETINELSPQTLASYKKKAGVEASTLDKASASMVEYGKHDWAKKYRDMANKRFSGIIKATKKELKV